MSDKVKKEIFNSVNENVQALAKLFPSVVKDGEVDFDALKEELGEFVEGGTEKYDFTWAGKSKAKAEARDSGEGLTLKLKAGEGVNEDTTQNIYIEGDNLKALKLLRNSYYGKVKMIFIDPPYNTGSDFVYKDNFTLSQEELDVLGENLDEEGMRLEKNSGDSAIYHTAWLNMLYSRLKIARDLLSEDGAIFVSIDYNEFANLKKMMDEIFGENNFQREIIWRIGWLSGYKTVAPNFIRNHDTILFYSKDANNMDFIKKYIENKDFKPLLKKDASVTAKLTSLGLDQNQQRDLLDFINHGNRPEKYPIEDTWNSNEYDDLNSIAIVSFSGEKISKILGINQEFKGQKSIKMIQRLLEATTKEDDIICDFFSGTASTAHAVMQLNAEDGGNRKYICVQIPEKCEEDSEAYKAGYKNICEIGKERIRRTGKKIIEENPDKKNTLDVGFKVFEVAETNIRMFNEEMKGNDLFDLVKETDKELRDFMPETKDIDVCYELLLRHRGVALSSSIEKLDIGERTYIIADSIVVCLDSEVTEEMVAKLAVIDPQPMKYIFRDSAFGDDISLKENTMIMLSALIEKTTGESKKAYKVEFI